jgi:hypothetical protein
MDRLYKAGINESKRHSTKHGEGFFEDFADGFQKGFTGTLKVAQPLLKIIGLGKKRRQSSRKHSLKGEGIISDVAGLLELGRRQSSRKHSRKSLKGDGVIADVASLFGLGKRRRHSSKGSALIGLPNRIGSSKAKRSHRRVSHKY